MIVATRGAGRGEVGYGHEYGRGYAHEYRILFYARRSRHAEDGADDARELFVVSSVLELSG